MLQGKGKGKISDTGQQKGSNGTRIGWRRRLSSTVGQGSSSVLRMLRPALPSRTLVRAGSEIYNF